MVIRPIVCRRFVGRSDELAYLHERRREAGASHGGLVLVGGEAGIGKSRLLSEFSASLAKSRWRVGIGRCLEFAQRPYGPILDVLARFDPAARELVPAASKYEQFEAIVSAFAGAAARTAIVAVVEDLHWADAATMELLAYLSARAAGMRLLVVASFRPEELHREHPLYGSFAKLERTPHAGRVELAPFAGLELRSFIDEALGDVELSGDICRAVARASEGNPFFLEELLKSAVEREPSTAAAGELPTTVRSTLMERLRPLGADERRVVAQAAVIGRRFELGLLALTLDVPAESLVPALLRARDLQLIVEDSATEFRFRHALTREAIYHDFLAAQVRPLHRTIALVLEASAADQRSLERLAYHWWAAGDAERATRYNELAGDAAGALHAHEDALVFYQRALGAMPSEAPARGPLLEKIAGRETALTRHDAALEAFTAAAESFRSVGDAQREAACRFRAALTAYTAGRADPTADLEAMLERLESADSVTRSRIHLGLAWIAATFYRPSEALQHVEQVDAQAVADHADVRLRFHNVRAWVAMTLGQVAAFRTEQAAWIEAARTAGASASAHGNSAYCFSLLGLHDDARREAEDALRVAREERNRHLEASVRAVSAFSYLLAGDLAGAHRAVEAVRAFPSDDQVVLSHAAAWGSLTGAYCDDDAMIAHWFDRLESTITPFTRYVCGAGYAEVLVRRGRQAEVGALLHGAIEMGDRPRGTVLTLLAVGRYGDEADWERARAVLVRVADTPDEMIERFAVHLFDAFVARRLHHDDDAVRSARTAAEGFRRLRFPLLEAAALEVAGERDAALAIYRRCGAIHDVRRLEPAAADRDESVPTGVAPVLSSREREIAELVARGQSNLQIARTLAISHKTVEKHLGSAYQKLGFSSRAQLGAYVSRG